MEALQEFKSFTRSDIVREARSWLKTPWHHQGRKKGHGCDCLGLIICTLEKVTGKTYANTPSYGHYEDVGFLLSEMRKHLKQIPPNEAKPGDIAVFEFNRHPHLGFFTDRGLIHAYNKAGRRVQEHMIPKDFEFAGAFTVPGVKG